MLPANVKEVVIVKGRYEDTLALVVKFIFKGTLMRGNFELSTEIMNSPEEVANIIKMIVENP